MPPKSDTPKTVVTWLPVPCINGEVKKGNPFLIITTWNSSLVDVVKYK